MGDARKLANETAEKREREKDGAGRCSYVSLCEQWMSEKADAIVGGINLNH